MAEITDEFMMAMLPKACARCSTTATSPASASSTRPAEETKEIMDGDPGVQAGLFVYEVHPCRGFPGDALPA